MLSKPEKQQLKQLLQSPQFPAFERLANELCDKYAYESPVRETEWETLRTTLTNQGMIMGIKKLIQELYANLQDNE